jgi:hypothetical protein
LTSGKQPNKQSALCFGFRDNNNKILAYSLIVSPIVVFATYFLVFLIMAHNTFAAVLGPSGLLSLKWLDLSGFPIVPA